MRADLDPDMVGPIENETRRPAHGTAAQRKGLRPLAAASTALPHNLAGVVVAGKTLDRAAIWALEELRAESEWMRSCTAVALPGLLALTAGGDLNAGRLVHGLLKGRRGTPGTLGGCGTTRTRGIGPNPPKSALEPVEQLADNLRDSARQDDREDEGRGSGQVTSSLYGIFASAAQTASVARRISSTGIIARVSACKGLV